MEHPNSHHQEGLQRHAQKTTVQHKMFADVLLVGASM